MTGEIPDLDGAKCYTEKGVRLDSRERLNDPGRR